MEWEERVKNCKTLDELRETAKDCETDLKTDATQMVFADGDPASKIMFIGEAPSEDGDKQGKPFVGKSGRVLNSMLNSISLARKDVYITNTVLWRPPNNRTPTKEEIKPFLPILRRHVELVAPKILVCLGTTAANTLLATDIGIERLRNKRLLRNNTWDEYTMSDGKVVPVMPTLHPASLLYEDEYYPEHRGFMQDDFNLIAKKMRELNLTQ